MNGDQESESATVGATETTFAIIEQLRDDGTSVTDLAHALDLSKSTIHNHLRTLTQLGYVVKEGHTYHLGLQFLDLGDAARDRWNLYEVAKQELDGLVSSIGEHGYVMVEEEGRGIYIYQSKTEQAVQTDSHIGTAVDLHATAVGKAYLAYLDDERRDELLTQLDLEELTESTYSDREALEAELDSINEQGYAFNDEERFVGMRAVGAPVLGPDGQVLAAISVSGPTTRMKGERYRSEIPEMVMQAARIIGIRVTYS
ncbi:IclR family transcriptional regulator [Halobellus sp. H-GB7]|uniref:IclR family transcriptional regulator n=1 Tax=Halobellus sp. H-GB7 TaxID=3069756 RepID=UPI0027B033F1|nr:IclR family transcriptional regulator [Halobellus sp. H-GB7]MDQ2054489.1 IclR family transcriptional regulator [Halobellus sp. H-GB7]